MVYAKMFMQIVGTLLATLVAFLTDGNVTTSEWLQIAVIGITAAQVFAGPNVPGAKYTKVILSALGAIAAGLVAVITDGVSPSEWLVIAIAVLTAVGVYSVKNSGSVVTVETPVVR